MGEVENQKYIGIVKWFHDKVKKVNIGFIEHAQLGDVFFHERTIAEGQDIESFTKDTVVVFTVQESKKHKGKLEAIGVKDLDTENDLEFLFGHFLTVLLSKGIYSDYNYLQKQVNDRIFVLLNSGENQEKKGILLKQFEDYIQLSLDESNAENEDFISRLLKISKHFFPESHEDISKTISHYLSDSLYHKLWLMGFFPNCSVNYISDNLLNFKKAESTRIFSKCTLDEKSSIFFRIIYLIEKIDTIEKIKKIKEILKLCKEVAADIHQKFLEATLLICPDYTRLVLWLEGYHEVLDFHAFKIYIITLPEEQQKRFVKKVLKYIHEGKVQIAMEDLTSLNLIDYETSLKDFEMGSKRRMDFSTSIILNVIQELHDHTPIDSRKDRVQARHRIVDLIINQIQKPDDILRIKGFFDECNGICTISTTDVLTETGEVSGKKIEYRKNEYRKPGRHLICDGQKAVDKITGKPILSKEGVEFWWCANQKCFKTARELHPPAEWEQYTLYDFLTILKVDFDEKDLETYLSVINKTNRFLNHMTCRDCKHILRPIRQANYAFYGVNEFHCVNPNCGELEKAIYITHCLNGRCEEVIDSRDSVKCKPTEKDKEKCGWYVCSYCHACCSNNGIERRKGNLSNSGQVYNCHETGHRDKGEICCNKCGSLMDDGLFDPEKYQEMLEWLHNNKSNKDYIIKYGSSDNGYWFLFGSKDWSPEALQLNMRKLLKLGFRIPDYGKGAKGTQLVTTRNSSETFLICRNKECGHIVDFSTDLEKASVMRNFHTFRLKTSDVTD